MANSETDVRGMLAWLDLGAKSGYIHRSDDETEVSVQRSALPTNVNFAEDEVIFDIISGKNGPEAVNVRPA